MSAARPVNAGPASWLDHRAAAWVVWGLVGLTSAVPSTLASLALAVSPFVLMVSPEAAGKLALAGGLVLVYQLLAAVVAALTAAIAATLPPVRAMARTRRRRARWTVFGLCALPSALACAVWTLYAM